MTSKSAEEGASREVRRQIRVVSILLAAERAGLTPVPSRFVHAIAYVADALAPVWELTPITPELLKRTRGPYDPYLQQDLDMLVGRTVLNVHNLSYERDEDDRWRVSADDSVRADVAQPLIDALAEFPDEVRVGRALLNICLGLASLPPDDVGDAVRQDATYSSRRFSVDSVVQLVDDDGENESARVVDAFGEFSVHAKPVTVPQAVNLYLRHLYRISTEMSA